MTDPNARDVARATCGGAPVGMVGRLPRDGVRFDMPEMILLADPSRRTIRFYASRHPIILRRTWATDGVVVDSNLHYAADFLQTKPIWIGWRLDVAGSRGCRHCRRRPPLSVFAELLRTVRNDDEHCGPAKAQSDEREPSFGIHAALRIIG